MTDTLPITERTRLRRGHKRGDFNRETINAILDAMPMCHIGYVLDGSPQVMPTFQWREGNHVYWHASSAGRGIGAAGNQDVCMTVSLLDGLVLARSAMHHSANFRSVMIFGKPTKITDPDEKAQKLGNLIDALYPGRNALLRPMTAQENKATAVLSLPIEEASAKIRSGGPVDDDEDYSLPIWAGVVPVKMQLLPVEADPRNLDGVEIPDHIQDIKIG
ncbi:MAG: flavin-nucleotide-binding protein [Rhodospirillaceae bacterium]|nr:MAG: flavin-nucleotide-binding protein [Rhodospirillaceae bacterium]